MKGKKFRSVTKGEIGIYKTKVIDRVTNRISHALIINGKEQILADITFKRWWEPVEEEQPKQETPQPKPKEVEQPKPKPRKGAKIVGVAEYFKDLVHKNGLDFVLYSEGREGVVKLDNKSIMFFAIQRNGVLKVCLKDELDFSGMGFPYEVEMATTYPKQFPYRFVVTNLDNQAKKCLQDIIKMYN